MDSRVTTRLPLTLNSCTLYAMYTWLDLIYCRSIKWPLPMLDCTDSFLGLPPCLQNIEIIDRTVVRSVDDMNAHR